MGDRPPYERRVRERARELHFTSETELDPERRLMRVCERYVGATMDERYDFVMRCWTVDEVRARATQAGCASVDVQRGDAAGIGPDRLMVTARR